MPVYRTTRCGDSGHHEFTIQLAAEPVVPDAHRKLVGYFENAVASGTTFQPGQTVQLGWSTLRLRDRADGTLGVEERELTPDEQWTESVDRALSNLWFQREVAADVGCLDEAVFPHQHDDVAVAGCAQGADSLLFSRLAAEDLSADLSGWLLRCTANHDHGEYSLVPLLAIAAVHPNLVQFLALPHGVTVLVRYRDGGDGGDGAARIEPHVFRDGREIVPPEGSYLAALRAGTR